MSLKQEAFELARLSARGVFQAFCVAVWVLVAMVVYNSYFEPTCTGLDTRANAGLVSMIQRNKRCIDLQQFEGQKLHQEYQANLVKFFDSLLEEKTESVDTITPGGRR
jgi:hypothetical protein